jgi:hypothetical protein
VATVAATLLGLVLVVSWAFMDTPRAARPVIRQ